MSSKEIGIEAARKTLGDLALEAQQGTEIILTRGNSRTPVARIAPLETPETCDVCAHQHRRPITPAQHGMCSQCHKRVKHTDDGTGHTLCDGGTLAGWIPTPHERPECPACAHTAATGEDPIRVADLRFLGYVGMSHPMYDHWTTEGYQQELREASGGRRLERDGYLDMSGEHPTPTTRGRALMDAYLNPVERTGAMPHLDVAAALRAIA